MAYGNNRNSGIPRLYNYAEALRLYETTAPIRGRKNEDGTAKDVRPLGHRRNTWYVINKNEQGDIECKMYDYPLVIFKANGETVVNNYVYSTTSTANFIWDVLRHKVNAYIYDFSLVVRVQMSNVEQRLKTGEGLTLTQDEGGNYHFANLKPEVTHVINRKMTNIVRAKYSDFMQYIRNMAKLRGEEDFTREEIENALGKFKGVDLGRMRYANPSTAYGEIGALAFGQFDKWVNSTGEGRFEDYYMAMLMLTQSYGKFNWRTGGYGLNAEYVEHGLDKLILGLNRDECFIAKPTNNGQVKRDPHGDYFKGVWQAYHRQKE